MRERVPEKCYYPWEVLVFVKTAIVFTFKIEMYFVNSFRYPSGNAIMSKETLHSALAFMEQTLGTLGRTVHLAEFNINSEKLLFFFKQWE